MLPVNFSTASVDSERLRHLSPAAARVFSWTQRHGCQYVRNKTLALHFFFSFNYLSVQSELYNLLCPSSRHEDYLAKHLPQYSPWRPRPSRPRWCAPARSRWSRPTHKKLHKDPSSSLLELYLYWYIAKILLFKSKAVFWMLKRPLRNIYMYLKSQLRSSVRFTFYTQELDKEIKEWIFLCRYTYIFLRVLSV